MDKNSIVSYRYFNIIRYLKPEIQLELIEMLSKALIGKITQEQKSITHLFGAWQSTNSATNIIDDIKNSRNTNRNIEEF